MNENDMNRELQALLTHMRQYDLEERTQGQQEADERRRAWHDGRASAYHDIIDRLAALLEEPRIESTDDLASHS